MEYAQDIYLAVRECLKRHGVRPLFSKETAEFVTTVPLKNKMELALLKIQITDMDATITMTYSYGAKQPIRQPMLFFLNRCNREFGYGAFELNMETGEISARTTVSFQFVDQKASFAEEAVIIMIYVMEKYGDELLGRMGGRHPGEIFYELVSEHWLEDIEREFME